MKHLQMPVFSTEMYLMSTSRDGQYTFQSYTVHNTQNACLFLFKIYKYTHNFEIFKNIQYTLAQYKYSIYF